MALQPAAERGVVADAAAAVAAELAAVEAAGEGQVFELDRYALEVSSAIRYRLRTGASTRIEQTAAET